MKILVIGSGGREHALVWKIAQSERVEKVYCAPGNGGTAGLAENVALKDSDIDGLLQFAQEQQISLTVVGPEVPLVAGIVDRFEEAGLRIFGPRANAAILEGSKAFSKDLMQRHGIPTAAFGRFTDQSTALAYLDEVGAPIVVKADGLAAGKGVLICQTQKEAVDAVKNIMSERQFGDAGNEVVIEAFLSGIELSMLCFTDGRSVVPMVSAKDYKKIGEGDQGLNTGGMGSISPNPLYDKELESYCLEHVCYPVIEGLREEGRPFKGILYCGLILSENGPQVLEFNARFGDPETQVILPRLKTDLVDIFESVIDGTLDELKIEWETDAAATVVLASAGYPEAYEKGFPITGLDAAGEVTIFHAGTRREGDTILTNGGRVLNVTGRGATVAEALEKAYAGCERIQFENKIMRTDIGI